MSLPPLGSPAPATIPRPLLPPTVEDNSGPPPLPRIRPLASPPSLPLPPLVDDTSPPPPLPQVSPFASLPSPPPPIASPPYLITPIVSPPPPLVVAPPPLITPIVSPPSPVLAPLPLITPIVSPAPLVLAPPPLITSIVSLPPSVAAPPPKAISTPIIPVKQPPAPSVTSPPLSPLPFPPKPATSSSPLPTTSEPKTSPPPLQTPCAPSSSFPSGTTPPTTPPPSRPNYPPPSGFPLAPPIPPTASEKSPLLSLPLANGSLPVSSKQSHVSTGFLIGCAIGGVFILVVLGLICIFKRRKRGRKHSTTEQYYKHPVLLPKDDPKSVMVQHSQQNVIRGSLPPLSTRNRGPHSLGHENPLPIQSPNVFSGLSSGTFTYDELVAATDGFSEANLIGEGGFGYVHKGFLCSGQEVAIKQLKDGSRQGEREFQAEVEIISLVHHKHLVSLIGYCIAGNKRFLVYDFVPNNTLEFHLHGNGKPVIEWAIRLKIAIESAKGLAYLHEDCDPAIIHRDIKAANILLDHKFEAKVSDFGLAKCFTGGMTSTAHISTNVVGTFGYLAPEYATSGKVTMKSDVYSYGVMLLELISGRRPVSDTNSVMREALVTWARPLLNQALELGDFTALVDPQLENNYNTREMANMVACAAACVRHSSWLRPRMSQIVHALEGDISAVENNKGMKPGHSTLYGSTSSSQYDTQYKQDIKKHNMKSISWQYGNTGYSGTTSEYGLNPSISGGDSSDR